MSYLTLKENKTMIILDMQHLKMVEEEEGVLVTLIFQVLSLIFLKIFLEKDLGVEEDQEDLTIEVLT